MRRPDYRRPPRRAAVNYINTFYGTPPAINGQRVESAFRHLPAHNQYDCDYTVITRDPPADPDDVTELARFTVMRVKFIPRLNRWAADLGYTIAQNLTWGMASVAFARRVAESTREPDHAFD